jgi:hypothetical protein
VGCTLGGVHGDCIGKGVLTFAHSTLEDSVLCIGALCCGGYSAAMNGALLALAALRKMS